MQLTQQHIAAIKSVALAGARAIRADGEECKTILFLINEAPEGRLGSIQIVNPIGLDKDQLAELHRKCARMPDIGAAMLLQEAWQLVLTPNQVMPDSIATHPAREEILMLNLLTRNDQYLLVATIEGRTIHEADFEKIDDQYAGRFIREQTT